MKPTLYSALLMGSAQRYYGAPELSEIDDPVRGEFLREYARMGMARVQRYLGCTAHATIGEMHAVRPGCARECAGCPLSGDAYDFDSDLTGCDPDILRAVSDYVTMRMLGSGNIDRQRRGEWYRERFDRRLGRMRRLFEAERFEVKD